MMTVARARERAVEALDSMQEHRLRKPSAVETFAVIKSTPLSRPTGMNKSTLTLSQVEPRAIRGSKVGDAHLGLECFSSELAT
jgi:hypothetical protein